MLISLNPHRLYDLVARICNNENKFALVIDNRNYQTLTTEQKATVYAYYQDQDPEDAEVFNWIIPEEEIDEILQNEETIYFFDTEIIAVDNCHDWLPQPQNLPDANHYIPAYVVKPDGTIPYTNGNPNPPA